MSLFKMVSYRVKKVIAWILAFAILALIVAGSFYVGVVVL